MNFNKVLNHFKVASFSFNRGPSENEKGSYFFVGFLLVPIHVCDCKVIGMVFSGDLNSIPVSLILIGIT